MSDGCCSGACDPPVATRTPGPVPRRFWLIAATGAVIAAGAAAGSAGHPALGRLAYGAAIALSVGTPAKRAWRALGTRVLDINVLMMIAVVGALLLGDWLEAAAVVWLFGVAQWLEARSMDRAGHAVRALVALAPTEAFVRREGAERRIRAADVRVGDVVIVRPGERLAVDGIVVRGESAVDEAPVTGESWPVEKTPGDAVFAGTINGSGAFEFEASRPSSDSTIARVRHLIEEAQRTRAPVQLLVDRFARRYTPAVVGLAAILAVVGPLTAGADWQHAFGIWAYRALTLLVVACPCALVISTPVSIVSALTAAARAGVLIKGGSHLERLARVTCVAFDKTGTLTDGEMSIGDVVAVDGGSAHGVLAVAAALESRSEHPIGRAIVSRALADGVAVMPGERFRALPGLGAEAMVAESPAIVGSHRLFEQRRLCTPALHAQIAHVEERGGSPVLVSHAGAPLGVIGFTDRMRASGREVVRRLHDEGVSRVVLLTGDRASSAEAARKEAGLDEAHGGLLPAEKVAHVARLRQTYGPVAMIGDGVNDAPALAAADVGIAMGAGGTDVALEAADIALVGDDLSKVPYAIDLAKRTLANIRGNLGIALGLKLAFIALAVAGLATLWMAVLADTGASILVTANSLRLLSAGSGGRSSL